MRGISMSSVSTSRLEREDLVASYKRVGRGSHHINVFLLRQSVGQHLPDDGGIVDDEDFNLIHMAWLAWPESSAILPAAGQRHFAVDHAGAAHQ